MSPQVVHALRQYAIALAAVVAAFFVENQTGILDLIFSSANIPEGVRVILEPSILAALAYSVRWIEGLRDSSRAAEGRIIPADVAYDALLDLAENPSVSQVELSGHDIYVEEPDAQIIDIPVPARYYG